MQGTTQRSLQVGFGLSLLILLATSVASYVSIRNLIYSSDEVSKTSRILRELENVLSSAKDAETGQRGYLLTGDPEFLKPYNGAYSRTMSSIDSTKSMVEGKLMQQTDLDRLHDMLVRRFKVLENLVQNKLVDVDELRKGRIIMDSARTLIGTIRSREQADLLAKTTSLNRFAGITPVVIIIAALLALFITIYFYRKVNENIKRNIRLNEELRAKDKEITERIEIIQRIASQISKGDYKVRLNAVDTDGLGVLSGSLNKMAEALDASFTNISNREWMQNGSAQLAEAIFGEKDLSELAGAIMTFIAKYTDSQVGALYVSDTTGLTMVQGYAVSNNERKHLSKGEGIAGQCLASEAIIEIKDISPNQMDIHFAAGDIRPNHIVAIPLKFDRKIRGVLELGSVHSYTPLQIEFLKSISENIGIAINTTQNRVRLQELLEETQAQSEELLAQHSELESVNAELEAQAEKLQTSEEELRVQQEELAETNRELEERSRLLEERNHQIVLRNLEIQKKSEELALSAKYKSEFMANMSHELRTPLNSILLLSRLLAENKSANLVEEQVESAKVIQSSGNSLLQLIDDILDISKIESGKMQLEFESVAIDEIIMDMRNLFEPLAREKSLSFIINASPDIPPAIETDKLRLEQILKNLVSNALKFTSQGSIELSIKKSMDPAYVDFIVKDTGIGIPLEKQEMIFEAFQQADGSTRRKYGGTGLGLSISRQLAGLLQGSISLKSEAGRGSEFTVTVPKVKTAVKEDKPIQESATVPMIELTPETVAPSANTDNEIRRQFISPTIPMAIPDDRDIISRNDKVMLIVEDDTAFAKALMDFSRKKGYKTVVCVRGDEALESARKYQPTGILLDIQLPVKSGWEVMEELKSDRNTRHIPVHIMSSYSVRKESLMSGAIDFINKPLAYEQMEQLFQKVEFYLKKEAKKVLIVEDNSKHAKALAYYLDSNSVNTIVSANLEHSLDSLKQKEVDCVILDMGVPDVRSYETLERFKQSEELSNIPIIVFTGKNLSHPEEMKIRQYADSIVVKTAYSYKRILDEVSLFLHLVEEKRSAAKDSSSLGTLGQVLKNKTVLIADDDVRNIFSLTKALEQHQMKVLPATDGKEALKVLKTKPDVDMVLMDMMMPEMDGYETIQQIRKNPKWRNLPIIAVTAKAMTGDREKCIEAGASDYISKPVDADQLVSLLRIWLFETGKK